MGSKVTPGSPRRVTCQVRLFAASDFSHWFEKYFYEEIFRRRGIHKSRKLKILKFEIWTCEIYQCNTDE